MENEIETPKEFIRESKKMLSHLQQFAEEHQKMWKLRDLIHKNLLYKNTFYPNK